MEIETKSDYLNSKSCQAGDIVKVLDEGMKATINGRDGRAKEVINFWVECNNNKMIYTPNERAKKIIKEAWGSESKEWIGKSFEVEILTILVAGRKIEVIEPHPQKTQQINK